MTAAFDARTIEALRAERKSVWVQYRRLEARLDALDLLLPADDQADDDADDRRDEHLEPIAPKSPAKVGRTRVGLRAKLSADDIETIRRLHKLGDASFEELGKRFKVSGSTASNVVNHKGCYK